MARTFSVDVDELADKVAEMVAFEQRIEAALTHLDRVVSNLHITWTGQAATAHTQAHQQWTSGMHDMKQGLAEVRTAADRAHANYRSAIQANLRMWASVR